MVTASDTTRGILMLMGMYDICTHQCICKPLHTHSYTAYIGKHHWIVQRSRAFSGCWLMCLACSACTVKRFLLLNSPRASIPPRYASHNSLRLGHT